MSFLSQPITLQSLFGQKRKVGDITLQVVINENTNDTLTITKQPVQSGASITDHAYKEPTIFSITAHFKDNIFSSIGGFLNAVNPLGGGAASGLGVIYQSLLDLQSSRVPFNIITPKRLYQNMLMASLGMTTDKYTENILAINATFQEIIVVSVGTVILDPALQKLPGATQATQAAGNKSALKIGFGG